MSDLDLRVTTSVRKKTAKIANRRLKLSLFPSEILYENAARQLLEQAPRSPEYVPDPIELEDHVPVYIPEPEHPEDLVPAEDEAPTPPLPPLIFSSPEFCSAAARHQDPLWPIESIAAVDTMRPGRLYLIRESSVVSTHTSRCPKDRAAVRAERTQASDKELEEPMKDQPLSADASPTALSPGYIADSNPEEDKEDPKEDPADHPADG
ncbi:hypothetical protein Tco_0303446 [Tanacetum coccineum]